MKTWLITGGCGFIGSNFIRHCLRQRHDLRIVNLDALTYAGNPANLAEVAADHRYRFVHGSIGDEATVAALLQAESVDAVVNFAAESHVDRSIDSPRPFFETNVGGTVGLLDATRRYWRGLPESEAEAGGFRFLHVSTDEVFGSLGPDEPPFRENTPYDPHSPYAASKAASDHLVRAYNDTYGLPAIITNCSNNYGPYQFPEKLIPLMILNAVDEEPLPVYGDGRNVRDWLHVNDHVTGILAALERGQPGETYCIGGNAETMNITVVETICSHLDELHPRSSGSRHRDLITFVTDRPGHDRRYAIDCSKISRELGWSPQHRFETGLRDTIQWYLDNRAWCEDIRSGRYQGERLGLSDD